MLLRLRFISPERPKHRPEITIYQRPAFQALKARRRWPLFLFLTLQPPFRRQITQGDNFSHLIIQQDFNGAVSIRHKLRHKLPTGAAGRNRPAVPVNRNHSTNRILAIGDHVEHRVGVRRIFPACRRYLRTHPHISCGKSTPPRAATPPASIMRETARG